VPFGDGGLTRALEISPEHESAQHSLAVNLIRAGKANDGLVLARRSRSAPWRFFIEALAQHDLGNARESQAALDVLTAKHASGLCRTPLRTAMTGPVES
jgi:hypothetical protein